MREAFAVVNFSLCLVLVGLTLPLGVRGKAISNYPSRRELPKLKAFPCLEDGLYYIDRDNYAQIVSAIASPAKEIILTTLSFQHEGSDHSEDQLELMKNFAFHLHQNHRLQNAFIVSYDHKTCQMLLTAGIICFMDHAAPPPATLPGETKLLRLLILIPANEFPVTCKVCAFAMHCNCM